ncbi:MAG: HutD family protein [Burkholderiales bacterium]|nr:HutD family protein [Burkholderiales bacterium]
MTISRLLSPRDFRRMPWRNGGGTTAEIMTWPEGAGGHAFVGRASIADIGRDGAFSAWPGFDRTIVLVDGDGIALEYEGQTVELAALHEPYRFPGDSACDCRLLRGPARAFNLMIRRGGASGRVVVVDGASAIAGGWRFGVCYAVRGTSECLLAGRAPIPVGPGQALVIDDPDPGAPMHVNPVDGGAVAIVVSVDLLA